MTNLPDGVLKHLRDVVELPDTSGTRYEIIEPVARGGMGVVFRAHDRELDRDVALKVLSLRDTSDDARARMLTEAHVLARLEHPGIVPVHDVGVLPDGRVFYAMKLVRGARLDDHARAHNDRAGLLRLFGRVCEAVAFAHARGIVHRDLKPENIMVGDFGEVLVMDWGVARLVGDMRGHADTRNTTASGPAPPGIPHRTTAIGTVLGTPGYMSPEQQRGEHVDARADVYALGVMLGVLVAQSGIVPRRLQAIVARATAVEPAARYQGVLELADDVGRFSDGLSVGAYREPWYEKAWRVGGRHRIAIVLVGTYILMRVLIFLVNRF